MCERPSQTVPYEDEDDFRYRYEQWREEEWDREIEYEDKDR